jgi:DNA transposition AAA+ family ATPase
MTNSIVELVPANRDLLPTRTLHAIHNILLSAMAAPDMGMGVIAGIAGIGKTEAIKAFAKGQENVVVATLSRLTRGPQSGLKAICNALGENVHEKGVNLEDTVKRRLAMLMIPSKDALLIIDEAQHAEIDLLEEVRHLWDAVQCGVVLVGNQQLSATFEQLRKRHPQIRSRVAAYLEIDGLDDRDLELFCKAYGVTPEAREHVRELSRLDGGSLRIVKTLLMHAEKKRGGAQGPILRQHVTEAALRMGLVRQ